MRQALVCLALVSFAAGARPASADVADYLGKPVSALRVEVEGRTLSDPRVLELIKSGVGTSLSMTAVRESIAHLMALGVYEDVRVSADLLNAAVRLKFELVPVHPVRQITFSGPLHVPGIDEGRLRRAVVDRYGASPPAGRRYDLAQIVENDLRQHGYLQATVTPSVELHHDPDRATLTFAIQPGTRTLVGRIDVVGNPGVPAEQLLSALRLTRGMAYEPDAIDLRLQEYRRRQWDAGYVEAKMSLATRFSDSERTVDITVDAERGPRVRVVFQGDPIPRDKRDELVPIVEEASADEDLLEDSSNAIEEYLRSLGYRDAAAPYRTGTTSEELTITFTVTRGPFYRVSDVIISDNHLASLEQLQLTLNIRKGQPFAAAALDADVRAIETAYQRQGFAGARAEWVADPAPGGSDAEVPVVVTMTIAEGVRTVIGSVRVRGNAAVPESEILRTLGLQPGRPFFRTQMAVDRDAIQLEYANRGYQSTTVDMTPGFSQDGARADIVFTVREGPQLLVDHVLVVGNVRTKTETIERELQLRAGDPLGLAAVLESQRRLAELGLFRRVRITQNPHGDENLRDVVVTVEESPATSVSYGGGLEALQFVRAEEDTGAAVEQLRVAPRAFFEVGRRNLFGKNRSVNLFTRISLRPDTVGTSGERDGFSEYRIFGAFREPRVFNSPADAYLTGTIEQQARSTFKFSRRAFNAEVARRLSQKVSVSGSYQIQKADLFDEEIAEEDKLLIDRLFPEVVLSSFSGSGVRSTRDDPLNPTGGYYMSANAQFAARPIGSDVGFLKSYLTAQTFRQLPQFRRSVLALSARLGMAYGFPRTVVQVAEDGEPKLGPDREPETEVVSDLPVSERFFAGGDTTVRGFALDQLGTPETLGANGLALGGNAVLIFNAELRIPIRGGFGIVGFVDAGNVFARTSDIALPDLRSSVGFGVRYQSPIGPLRVDMGYKTRRYAIAGQLESANALHISLGQAF